MIMEQTNKNMHREQSLVTTSNQARPGHGTRALRKITGVLGHALHCTYLESLDRCFSC
jgi:hypothetical protein